MQLLIGLSPRPPIWSTLIIFIGTICSKFIFKFVHLSFQLTHHGLKHFISQKQSNNSNTIFESRYKLEVPILSLTNHFFFGEIYCREWKLNKWKLQLAIRSAIHRNSNGLMQIVICGNDPFQMGILLTHLINGKDFDRDFTINTFHTPTICENNLYKWVENTCPTAFDRQILKIQHECDFNLPNSLGICFKFIFMTMKY